MLLHFFTKMLKKFSPASPKNLKENQVNAVGIFPTLTREHNVVFLQEHVCQ